MIFQRKMQIICLSLSGICLVTGILQNQHNLTLEKAIRLCLECIGIG